jgi:hypothetical protein
MKVILEIDGGGAKGVIPFTVLKNMESKIGKPLHEWVDLVVSTSVGTIVGSSLLIGDKSAKEAQKQFKEDIKDIFKKRFRVPIIQPLYSIDKAKKKLEPYIGGKKLKEAKSKFMFTSVNMVTGRTHFFKSWEEKDGGLDAMVAVPRSFAAPLFFGSLKDKENKAVWLDGGTSNNSCPLLQAYIEILRQGWVDETEVHIISLGCGHIDYSIPYEKAIKYNNIKQVYYYMNPTEGGLARVVAADTQIQWLKELTKKAPNFSFQRIEYEFKGEEKKMDGMDKVQYLDEYERIGEQISKDVDYSFIEG